MSDKKLMLCDELKWKWAYGPYLDPPEGQKESAIKAGYVKVVSKQSADEAIAELKDKCQMHDFFWEGCGFAKRGFKNTIAVSEELDRLEAENAELKAEIESLKASHYAEMVDAGMRERRLRRALWLTRALRARDIQRWWLQVTCSPRTGVACMKWNNAERKCRAKAEQYK